MYPQHFWIMGHNSLSLCPRLYKNDEFHVLHFWHSTYSRDGRGGSNLIPGWSSCSALVIWVVAVSFKDKTSNSVLLSSSSIVTVSVSAAKESEVTPSVILFGSCRILRTTSHSFCASVASFLMISLYSPITAEVLLFANNFDLQIQNVANFSPQEYWTMWSLFH